MDSHCIDEPEAPSPPARRGALLSLLLRSAGVLGCAGVLDRAGILRGTRVLGSARVFSRTGVLGCTGILGGTGVGRLRRTGVLGRTRVRLLREGGAGGAEPEDAGRCKDGRSLLYHFQLTSFRRVLPSETHLESPLFLPFDHLARV